MHTKGPFPSPFPCCSLISFHPCLAAVLKPLYALDAVSPTWLSQSFEHSVWTDNRNDGQFETINMTLLDYYVRMPAVGRAGLN